MAFVLRSVCAAMLMAAAACSIAPPGVDVHDPYEAQNREVHAFNKSLDQSLFGGDKDDAVTGHGVPDAVAIPVVNFADNIALPGMVLNGLLQGDLEGAASNATRFLLNSTLGLAGLLDPADDIGLLERETDFAQTLTVWGVPEGAYLELPVIGPSTERDLAGRIVDAVIDPLGRYTTPEQSAALTVTKLGARAIKRSQFGDTVDSVLYESADSYAQQRLIYLQNRRFELGVTSDDDAIDPYDELFGDAP